MSYFDHFRELRNRLILCFIFLISIFIISFFYSEKITNILTYPLYDAVGDKENKRMIFTGLPEVFVSYLKISLFSSFLVSFPFFIIQMSLFISPALYKKEKNSLYLYFTLFLFCFILVFYSRIFFNTYYLGFFCIF